MECNNCYLHTTRRNIVKNIGNIKASILFIFEYPSRSDDVVGKICSGQDGRLLEMLLNDAFAALNIVPKEYFATSLLRCIPIDNKLDIIREPNEHEILACMFNLFKIINRMNFKHMFLVGKLAEKFLSKQLPGSVSLVPIGMLVKQGGIDSHWYKYNLRKIMEGLK